MVWPFLRRSWNFLFNLEDAYIPWMGLLVRDAIVSGISGRSMIAWIARPIPLISQWSRWLSDGFFLFCLRLVILWADALTALDWFLPFCFFCSILLFFSLYLRWFPSTPRFQSTWSGYLCIYYYVLYIILLALYHVMILNFEFMILGSEIYLCFVEQNRSRNSRYILVYI